MAAKILQKKRILLGLMAVATARAEVAELYQHHKRQNYAVCVSECNTYSTTMSNCALNIQTYSDCICSSQMISDILLCLNCSVSAASSQVEINQAQIIINAYASSCAALGHAVSIVPTARPTVSFPCTEPGAAATASASNPFASLTNAAGATSTRHSATSAPGVSATGIPGLSIDPSQLIDLSSILGAVSDQLNSLTLSGF